MTVNSVSEKSSQVSILIPVSGNPVYLNETIQSVLAQTYKNFEVVIVLNNADSWVQQYLKKISEQDERFRVLITTEKGISNALNIGLAGIQSALVCRLDSDDLMKPSRVEKQVNFLSKNPDIGVVGSQIRKVTKDGHYINTSKFPTKKEDVRKCLTVRNVIAHSSVMFRRELIEQVEGYQSQFNGAEDYDLWIRLREKTELANIDESLTTYRVWSEQSTKKNLSLIHNLLRIIHTREFSDLDFVFSTAKLDLTDLKSLWKHYYLQSLKKSIISLQFVSFVRMIALNMIDVGVERLKHNKSYSSKALGLLLALLASPIYFKEMTKIFLIPLFHQEHINEIN